MNRWRIPAEIERAVRERDRECIYCRVLMLDSSSPDGSRRNVATWEHIVNDASIRHSGEHRAVLRALQFEQGH